MDKDAKIAQEFVIFNTSSAGLTGMCHLSVKCSCNNVSVGLAQSWLFELDLHSSVNRAVERTQSTFSENLNPFKKTKYRGLFYSFSSTMSKQNWDESGLNVCQSGLYFHKDKAVDILYLSYCQLIVQKHKNNVLIILKIYYVAIAWYILFFCAIAVQKNIKNI